MNKSLPLKGGGRGGGRPQAQLLAEGRSPPGLRLKAQTDLPFSRGGEERARAGGHALRLGRLRLHPHHDLAEVLVRFHALERLADIIEREHLIDRQLQLARFHCRPQLTLRFVEDLADLLD